MTAITVELFPDELEALVLIATDECRTPNDQLVYWLRKNAFERGLIQSSLPDNQSARPTKGGDRAS